MESYIGISMRLDVVESVRYIALLDMLEQSFTFCFRATWFETL
jgi:hypothetical protein